jgi:hypothetical protein
MIYSNVLKQLLKEKYKYHDEQDCFTGIISKFIPIESDFIHFFEETIIYNSGLSTSTDTFIEEFETDELCSLFKIWVKTKINDNKCISNGNISENSVIKIIKHFFPNIKIVENKYIVNIHCTLWNKINEIELSIEYIKQQIHLKSIKYTLISFDEAYNFYYKYCNLNNFKLIVSKQYFEKYLNYKFHKYIVYEKFIEVRFFLL